MHSVFCWQGNQVRRNGCFPNNGDCEPVFPLGKLYTEQMYVLLRTHTQRMQLRNHADTQPVRSVSIFNRVSYSIYIQY